ncbi:autotransporter-associated beta strand repeat-containing protein [Salaquimonas pukyongi]|uniref:autotransporter-associated beta strand repeat-containing protein n=1 Tax=Salaquimonas pukyongi TaxID=2712698 RepID=UPI0009F9308E|nr:autotransporter-associated beta strand repeat-containing protein [Salaquimonas pukyongi]
MRSRVTRPTLIMPASAARRGGAAVLRDLRRGLLSSVAATVLAMSTLNGAAPALAADTHWTGAGGDTNWNNPANWSNGLPGGNDTSRIRNGQTATVDGITASGNRYTYIGGNYSAGHVDVINGGNLSGGCCFYIGDYGDGSMTVSGTGSTVSAGGSVFVVGQSSTRGELLITNGGTVNTPASYTMIGRYGGSEGVVTISGTGSLFQSGGHLMLGGESASSTYNTKGTLNLVEGGLVRAGGSGIRKIIIAHSNGSTGTVNVGNGGTPGTVEASSIQFGNGTGVLNFNHTNTGYSFTVPITGNGEVRQLAGTTVLSGSNSYSGGTTINGGTLRAGSASALGTGLVTVAADGTLDLGTNTGASALGGSGLVTLNANTLTLSGDGNGSIEQESTYAGIISGTGGLIINNGNDNQILTGDNTFSGGIAVAGGALTLGSNTAAGTGPITTTGSVIGYLNGVNSAAPIIINSNTTQLEVNGTDTAVQSGVISESGGVRPLEKIGTGTLTLSAANTYTGTTTITSGTLNVTGSLASNALVVQDGAALQADGAAILDTASVTLNGSGNLSLTGNEQIGSLASASNTSTVVLGANLLTTGGAANTSFAGSITGSGGLTKEGNGIFSLTGSSNYTGATTVSAGTLEVTGTGALGGTGGVTISNSGTLQVDAGALAAAQAVQINGTGTFDVDGDTAIGSLASVAGTTVDIANSSTLTVNQGTNGTIAGVVQGGGGLTKAGAANLILTGNNTYAGLTTINSGTLELRGNGAISDGTIGDDGSEGSILVNAGGTLQVAQSETIASLSGAGNVVLSGTLTTGDAGDDEISGVISGTGLLIKQGAGNLTLSGNNTNSGDITVDGGTLTLASNAAAGTGSIWTTGSVVAYANGVNIANPIVVSSNTTQLEVNGTDAAEQSGVISQSGGARPLEKTGTGTLTLSAANTYTGTTTITAGTLNVTGSLASTALVAKDGATLQADGAAIHDSAAVTLNGTGILSLTGSERIGSLASTSAGSTVSLGANTLTTGDAANAAFAGSITGTGGLTKEGAGTFSLTGGSNYTGTTAVNGGILDITGTGALSGAGGVTINNNGTLRADAGALAAAQAVQVNGTGTFDVDGDTTIGRLTGMAGSTVDIASGSALTVNQGSNGTFAGNMQGDGGLTKGGAANLILTGNNSYTGTTTVSGGVLEIKNAGVLSSTGGIVINSGEVETDGGGLGTGRAVTLNGAGLNSMLDLNGDEQIASLAGVGTVDFDSILTIKQAADTVFSGNLVGNGNLEKSGAGSLTLSGNNTFGGGIDHKGGTLELASQNAAGTSAIFNAAILNITSNLSGSGLLKNENGGVANFGGNTVTGFTGFQNDAGGTASFGSGSSFNAGINDLFNNGLLNADGAVALTGKSFTNAGGRLSMKDGVAGDALTINAAFAGTGTLSVDVDYAANIADVLAINGDVTGGKTMITLNDVTTGKATGNDILVVDGNGAMPADAFSLAAPATSGAFTYDLSLVGNDWFLTLALAPSTATYEAHAALLTELNGTSGLLRRLSNRNWGNGSSAQANPTVYGFPGIAEAGDELPGGIWTRVEAAHSFHDASSSTAGQSRDTNIRKLHFGFDGPVADAGNGTVTAGLFGFIGSAHTDISSPTGDGSIATRMYGAGGSLTWLGTGGLYFDAVGQFSWYKSDLESDSAGTLNSDMDATGYSLSAEFGKRLYFSENRIAIPQAQITYSGIDFDSFTTNTGSTVKLTDGDSLKGRLGIALGKEAQWENDDGQQNRSYTYLNLDLENEFFDGTEIKVAGTALRNENDRLTGTAALGGTLTLNDGRLSVFGEVAFSTSLENLGDSGTVRGNAGFKLHF